MNVKDIIQMDLISEKSLFLEIHVTRNSSQTCKQFSRPAKKNPKAE